MPIICSCCSKNNQMKPNVFKQISWEARDVLENYLDWQMKRRWCYLSKRRNIQRKTVESEQTHCMSWKEREEDQLAGPRTTWIYLSQLRSKLLLPTGQHNRNIRIKHNPVCAVVFKQLKHSQQFKQCINLTHVFAWYPWTVTLACTDQCKVEHIVYSIN